MQLSTFTKLFNDAHNPVLFLGSGISRSAPSSVPLFWEMLDAYLDALNSSNGCVLKRHAGNDEKNVREKIGNLPIDEFFADMLFAFGPKILEPLDWMKEREPNQSHELLSTLAKTLDIRTIITPNFDCLMEKVLTDFGTISFVKRRSPTGRIDILGHQNQSTYGDSPTYLNPAERVVFHLHGTSIESQIVITPETTSITFDHFDHANLAVRLDGATVLVAGSSGGWDNDILDLLKRCNIERVLWIAHGNNKESVSSVRVPRPWEELFQKRAAAIKGNTNRILAKIAKKDYLDEDNDKQLIEFRKCVAEYLKSFDTRWKLHTLAVLANKVFHGNVAHSILDDVEQVPITDDFNKIEKEKNFLSAIANSDHLTMRDGRLLTPEEFLEEYNDKKLIFEKMKIGTWPIVIGRTRAIAMSRNPKNKCNYHKVIKFLQEKVIAELDKIIPYASIGLKEASDFKWVTREWMLIHESLGIIYLENRNSKPALEHINLALRICMNEEDHYRLQRTKIITECLLELCDLLGLTDAKEIEMTLQDEAGIINDDKLLELMKVTDKCFSAGGRIRALEIYKAITAKRPDKVNASLNYSNMLKAMREREQALIELERCLTLNPNSSQLLCNKGFLLNEIGRQRDAIPVLESALEIDPRDWHAWNNLGNSYYDMVMLREALDKYEKALLQNPKFKTALINKENTLRRLAHQIW